MTPQPPKIKPPSLEERLRKANIEPDELADLLWKRIQPRMVKLLSEMADKKSAERSMILASVIGGLAVQWADGPGERIAELAERITASVMRAEQRRIDGNGNGY